MTPDEARTLLADADLVCSAEESALAVRRIADQVTAELQNQNPWCWR